MRDADSPNKPEKQELMNCDNPALDRFEQRLRSFQPRSPQLSLPPEVLRQGSANDENLVLRASMPTSTRSSSLGLIAGSWICGAAVGAGVMFCFFQISPRGVDSSLGSHSINRDAEPIAALDRSEHVATSAQYNSTYSEKYRPIGDTADTHLSLVTQSSKIENSFGDTVLTLRLLDNVNLDAGYYLRAGGRFVSTSPGTRSGQQIDVIDTADASGVHNEHSIVEKSDLEPSPPATRDRMLRELLNASPHALL